MWIHRRDVAAAGGFFTDFHVQAAYSGTYNGPTDLSTVLLWEAVMTQKKGNRDVGEAGRAIVQRSNGEKFRSCGTARIVVSLAT